MLGVGLLYQPVTRRPAAVPERGRPTISKSSPTPCGTTLDGRPRPGSSSMATPVGSWRTVRQRMPILLHGIGLSIGRRTTLDPEYVDQFVAWAEWLDCPWISEHLAYRTSPEDDTGMNVGLTSPGGDRSGDGRARRPRVQYNASAPWPAVPAGEQRLLLLDAGRGAHRARVLNRLCADWERLLLDLHNLYVNVRNGADGRRGGTSTSSIFTRFREIHIAGGRELDGFYVDGAPGAPPQQGVELDAGGARCPNLGGITFELLGSWFDLVGRAGTSRSLTEPVEHCRLAARPSSRHTRSLRPPWSSMHSSPRPWQRATWARLRTCSQRYVGSFPGPRRGDGADPQAAQGVAADQAAHLPADHVSCGRPRYLDRPRRRVLASEPAALAFTSSRRLLGSPSS